MYGGKHRSRVRFRHDSAPTDFPPRRKSQYFPPCAVESILPEMVVGRRGWLRRLGHAPGRSSSCLISPTRTFTLHRTNASAVGLRRACSSMQPMQLRATLPLETARVVVDRVGQWTRDNQTLCTVESSVSASVTLMAVVRLLGWRSSFEKRLLLIGAQPLGHRHLVIRSHIVKPMGETA